MSSIPEKPSQLAEKRQKFFRSNSLQKIKCSAYYSLQLAGSILSRETLMQLFEAMIHRSKEIIQKAFRLLLLPAFKFCCAMILLWIDAFTKYTGINFVFEKKVVNSGNIEPEKTYILRVQKQKSSSALLSDVNGNNSSINKQQQEKNKDYSQSQTSYQLQQPTVSSCVPDSMPLQQPIQSGLKPITENDLNQFNARFVPKLVKSDSQSDLGSNSSISGRQNLGLIVIVYGSATLVYIQLMLLAVFLQTSATPPGLVFLVTSLAYIGYIVYKICFVKAKTKDDSSLSSSTSSKNQVDESKTGKSSRLQRSTTRRFLYFHNKTLSKIKLL